MMCIKIGVMSDLHLHNKTANIKHALSKLRDTALILIPGDIADRADEKQYRILLDLLGHDFAGVPVYCVSGNHDNPARDDTSYRQFEREVNEAYSSIVDESGAFYKRINAYIDLIGLNPSYHQKQFFFSNRGQQLTFLQEKLQAGVCKYHIVMCHPPLIAHNPQRTADMAPYITAEQDARLQKIIDANRNVIFLSGHTHVFPSIEFDEVHRNLYINDGSICPTSVKDIETETRQGNVILLEIAENEIHVTVEGIYNGMIFAEEQIST